MAASDNFLKYLAPIRIEGRPTSGWTSDNYTAVNAGELITKSGMEYYLNANVLSKVTVSGGSSDASGKFVTLDANGLLDTSILPSLAITNTTVITATTLKTGISDAIVTALGASGSAQVGDVVIFNPATALTQEQVEAGTYAVGSYIITAVTTSGDSTTYTVQELTTASDGVVSINGSSSQYVTLNVSDIYAVNPTGANAGTKASIATSVSAYGAEDAEDYKFPTAKAVTDFASNASNLASGTVDAGRLPLATSSTVGAASFDSTEFTVSAAGAVTINASALGASTFESTTENPVSDDDLASVGAVKDYVESETEKLSAYATITGDGSSDTFTITHGLGSANLLVQIVDSNGKVVYVPTTISSTTVAVAFGAVPAFGTTYTVVMMKLTGAAITGDGKIVGNNPPGV